ncbi:MAG: hypothetical protein D6776_04870 [Planctomycetota bacterium]|nr:MAG: hypothetical protein D6776_04870 [Planctomycetota bacterium]
MRRHAASLALAFAALGTLAAGLGFTAGAGGALLAIGVAALALRRERAEGDALAREHEADRQRLAAIVEQLPIGVLLLDAGSGEIAPINPAGRRLIAGAAPGHEPVSFTLETPDGNPLDPERNPLCEALRTGAAVEGRALRLVREGGDTVELEVAAAPLVAGDGRLLGAIATFADRTEAVRTRTELERMLAVRSEFLGTVSHALRTPLTVVTGFADLLWEGSYGPLPEPLRHPLGRLRANASHLLELVAGLLDLTRLRTGRLELEHETFELTPLLWDAAAAVRRAACDRVEVQLDLEQERDAPVRVRADRARLRQALRQLCAGAIELEPGGVLRLHMRPIRDASGEPLVEVVLSDAGQALDGDLLALVLADGDPAGLMDLSGDESGRTAQLRVEQSGVRVGVRTAAALLHLMGGRLAVERPADGGTRLCVRLPRVVSRPSPRRMPVPELSHVG